MDVTVVIGTYGDLDVWGPLADRARASVAAVDPKVPIIHSHGPTLHEARNRAVADAETEWIVTCDADDELEPFYFDHMDEATADLRAPLVRYVKGRRVGPANIPRGPEDMRMGNRLVIGTAVRRAMFLSVGGFEDWPMYEDWALWSRCVKAGATVEFTKAVYRAHVRRGSRNRAPSRTEKQRWHDEIHRAVWESE